MRALAARDSARGESAAAFVGTRSVRLADLPKVVGRVLVAVTDSGIPGVARILAESGLHEGTVLHTCGAHGPELLSPLIEAGVSCGVMHPLQTFSTPDQGARSLEGISFGVAGAPPALEFAHELIGVLGGRALHVDVGHFAHYHAAAVMVSSASLAMLDAAVSLMCEAGVDRQSALRALAPLCRTALDNGLALGPAAALTGPVARGDVSTVAAHLAALQTSATGIEDLYRSASRRILDMAASRGLPDKNIQALESLLRRHES